MEGHGSFQRDRGTALPDFHSHPDVNAYFDCAQYKHFDCAQYKHFDCAQYKHFDCAQYKHAESHLDLEPGRAEHADRFAHRYPFPHTKRHTYKIR